MAEANLARMGNLTRIHKSKQPRRPHHIEDWAEKRHLTQADIARQIGADKSIVSRWFNGSTPGIEWQHKLAALFHTDTEGLFRDPDEDWLSRKLRRGSRDQRERLIRMIEAAFPDDPKEGTNG